MSRGRSRRLMRRVWKKRSSEIEIKMVTTLRTLLPTGILERAPVRAVLAWASLCAWLT